MLRARKSHFALLIIYKTLKLDGSESSHQSVDPPLTSLALTLVDANKPRKREIQCTFDSSFATDTPQIVEGVSQMNAFVATRETTRSRATFCLHSMLQQEKTPLRNLCIHLVLFLASPRGKNNTIKKPSPSGRSYGHCR